MMDIVGDLVDNEKKPILLYALNNKNADYFLGLAKEVNKEKAEEYINELQNR